MFYSDRFAARYAPAMVSMLYLSGILAQAHAAPGPDAPDSDANVSSSGNSTPKLDEIVVIAQHLNEARNGIQTQTGASIYTINEAAIGAMPGGDNQLLNQVMSVRFTPPVGSVWWGRLSVTKSGSDSPFLNLTVTGSIAPSTPPPSARICAWVTVGSLIRSLAWIVTVLPLVWVIAYAAGDCSGLVSPLTHSAIGTCLE